jgi:hypothetical protein
VIEGCPFRAPHSPNWQTATTIGETNARSYASKNVGRQKRCRRLNSYDKCIARPSFW